MFQNSLLKNAKQDEGLLAIRWAKFQDFKAKIEDIKNFKEEEYQDKFLSDIFENCLGYTLKTSNPKEYNLSREKKNETDSKKADGALHVNGKVVGIIELKDQKTTHLDSVQIQAFNYHNSHANSRYIIISNFDELRFYIDKKTQYEKFSLFNLNYEEFKKLHLLLSYESIKDGLPLILKEKSIQHEKDISDRLYKDFSDFRTSLFENIVKNNFQDKNLLLRLTQKLCDRIIFILFAEDRGLLKANTIHTIREDFANQKFSDFTLYDIYKFYFNGINKGDKKLQIPKYNGGLFADDETLNSLIIDDEILDEKVQKLSNYDFQSDIGVNILGHIFEQSLTDLEQMNANINQTNFDEKKSKRKKDGVFYTPEYITNYIVENTLGKLCFDKKQELNILHVNPPKNSKRPTKKEQITKDALQTYKNWLLDLKILDPACGSGAFLNQALDFLIKEHEDLQKSISKMGDVTAYYDIAKPVLENNLYGVDINEDATEIAKLSLWLRTATKGRELTKLADKIKCGNSLIDDKEVAENAFIWEKEFPEVFANGGFDVVIGNPPYVDSENMTKSSQVERKWITKNYLSAKGNWDLFIPFIELGMKLTKNNLYTAFIIPNKILSSNYAKHIRYLIGEKYSLNEIFDVQMDDVFDVDVYPILLFLQKKKQNKYLKISKYNKINIFTKKIRFKKENNWSLYFNEYYVLYMKLTENYPKISDCGLYKLYSSASVSEAYEVKEHITENCNPNSDYYKLINTGTIDPYLNLWGTSYMQYIKGKYKYPIILKNNIKSKAWTSKPKISIAGMSIKIEAFLDLKGEFIPLKSTSVITSNNIENLKYICGLLNSKLYTFIFSIENFANKMSGGYFNVNDTNIGSLPFAENEDKNKLCTKADQMLELNKSLHETKQAFLNELDLEKIPKKLQDFEKLSFDEFVSEYKKAKKLKFQNKLEERTFKNDWKDMFAQDKKQAQTLQEKIQQTDNEIDKMVYALYDLTNEEIAIVEGGI